MPLYTYISTIHICSVCKFSNCCSSFSPCALFFVSDVVFGLWLLQNMTSIYLKLSCGLRLIFSMRPFAFVYSPLHLYVSFFWHAMLIEHSNYLLLCYCLLFAIFVGAIFRWWGWMMISCIVQMITSVMTMITLNCLSLLTDNLLTNWFCLVILENSYLPQCLENTHWFGYVYLIFYF